ncbi:MAG: hypothetical protein ABL962_14075, partial [Fimbriimonadaceae bacterium]
MSRTGVIDGSLLGTDGRSAGNLGHLMGKYLPCFKAYDVRGVVPEELNTDVAYAIGRAFVEQTQAKSVCVGYDIRLSGLELCEALTRGLNDAGSDVIQLGLIGTEMVYFATANYGFDGGIMITASHNPPQYNGMKMVRSESRPISSDTGLLAIEERAYALLQTAEEATGQGSIRKLDCYEDFVKHLLNIVKPSELKPLRVLADPGNGAAGLAMDQLCINLPLEIE